ncbi:hypothetical protein SPRG_04088 [Saprolegnia parasitica CBS 223.65]|uniref:Chromatin assembly factor 1 subunit A dimerization domain-containing protein n=1 Tax=Saprolegnia parasitica (strain CBS 223.65) TaxID=695850 RepID=A0A067CLS2_SAPPC|nr:hypothetical protein SPRG_04088 [Saprolegnia parasitica CBS 223.65]KDO31473.1 hypothetical protein SPRG_04088 [Saprolegnia parasitica CBS 223.65]|eukprot:XP_012198066.1 hypothetical protein SPRG_04088 [Saprolegnia parasitica CBS 223.65]
MTTPEKKQKSIAAFFSPVTRAAAPPAAANLVEAKPPAAIAATKSTASPMQSKPSTPKRTPIKKTTEESAKRETTVAAVVSLATAPQPELAVATVSSTPPSPAVASPPKEKKPAPSTSGSASAPIDVAMDSDDAPVTATKKRRSDNASEAKVPAKKLKGKASRREEENDHDDTASVEIVDEPPTKETRKRTRPVRQAALAPKVAEPVEVVVAPPTPVVVLSPAQQQKLDLYLSKLHDAERAIQSGDPVAHEIYGLALDSRLELHPALQDECTIALSSESSDVAPALKTYLARYVQGSMDALSVLVSGIRAAWTTLAPDHVFNSATVEMEIKVMAERIAYGAKPKKSNLFEDTTTRALYVWEVGKLDGRFGDDDSVKVIRRMRKQRKRTGAYLKTLDRIVGMLQDAKVDDSKLSVEEAKASKFLVSVEMEKQRALEKEQKATLALEKEEAKRKEKEDAAEKKRLKDQAKEDAEVAKRRQTLVSYFQPTPAKPTAVPAPPVTVDLSNVDADAAARLLAMDKALGLSGSSASGDVAAVAALRKQRAVITPGSWSSRRVRHPTLGIKKLLQFHENYRPAYCGTFSKKTRVLRRGRKPLALVPSLDYSIDSDDEWEEEEVGESLSDQDSDEDAEDGDDALDYGDKWLAYEDEVDYVDRAPDDEAATESRHVKVSDMPKASKLTKLVPRILGPYYTPSTAPELTAFRIELLHPIVLESPLLKKKAPAAEPEPVPPKVTPTKVVAKPTPSTKAGLTTWLQAETPSS